MEKDNDEWMEKRRWEDEENDLHASFTVKINDAMKNDPLNVDKTWTFYKGDWPPTWTFPQKGWSIHGELSNVIKSKSVFPEHCLFLLPKFMDTYEDNCLIIFRKWIKIMNLIHIVIYILSYIFCCFICQY